MGAYYRLVGFLARYTDRMIGLPLGIPAMAEILEEEYYKDLEGGILEALGRLLKTGVSSTSILFSIRTVTWSRLATSKWRRTWRTSTRTCLKTVSSNRSGPQSKLSPH